MDELAANTLAALKRTATPAEQQLALFNSLKSSIKHSRVPESAQPATLDCIRVAITSRTSTTLVTAGLSALTHYIKRLHLQDQIHAVFAPRGNIVPILLDKLADQKEAPRAAASQCLCDLWSAKTTDIENAIREKAIGSATPRAKEAGMQWVAKMHREQGLAFRGFVAPIVECLDHADGAVRECAKAVIVDLFKDAPSHAKADLKRQMTAHSVRKSIETYILSQLEPAGGGAAAPDMTASTSSVASSKPTASRQPTRPQTPAGPVLPDSAAGEPTLPPSAEVTNIEPLYINTARELDDEFRTMAPWFEGREEEGNWKQRDNAVLKLRRMTRGNVPVDMHVPFLAGIKNMLDGILKVVNSLRTTMSTNGCQLVQELARTLGSSIDSLVEILLQSLVKMCSATKNIAAQNANVTVEILISSVSYNARLMQHVWLACQDKNVQPRTFASAWLKTILKRHTHNKTHFEHSGGLELTEKIIKKGLADANPKVRENMRCTFWTFEPLWPDKAEKIMGALDAKSQALLQNDPNNPSAPKSAVAPAKAASKPAPRSSLREQIAAQRQAAAKRLPDRPNSAMATVHSNKPTPSASRQASTMSTASQSVNSASTNASAARAAKAKATGTLSSGQASLMSAPMRRPRNLNVARPATADPYAHRNMRSGTPGSSIGSPLASPGRPVSKGSISGVMGAQNSRANSSTTLANRPGSRSSSVATSPRETPQKPRPKTMHLGDRNILATVSPPTWRSSGPSTPAKSTGAKTSRSPLRPQPEAEAEPEVQQPRFSSPPAAATDDEHLTFATPSGPQHKTSTAPTEAGQEEDVAVYEDPEAGEAASRLDKSTPAKPVLEELPLNETAQQGSNGRAAEPQSPAQSALSHDDETPRTMSPAKRILNGLSPERSDGHKNRRLLVSGAERLRAKSLDAHGFRRLQELVKNSSSDLSVPLAELLQSLAEYVESSNEAIGGAAGGSSKASSLRSQALATARAIITVHRREEAVRRQYARAMQATVWGRQYADASSHVLADLDKTGEELVRHAHEQTLFCLEAVLGMLDRTMPDAGEGRRRVVTGILGTLSKLLSSVQVGEAELTEAQRQRLGQVAVQLLDDADADVRKADTELCLALHGTYEQGQKEAFWTALAGARETQLNLVAYYIARRSQASASSEVA